VLNGNANGELMHRVSGGRVQGGLQMSCVEYCRGYLAPLLLWCASVECVHVLDSICSQYSLRGIRFGLCIYDVLGWFVLLAWCRLLHAVTLASLILLPLVTITWRLLGMLVSHTEWKYLYGISGFSIKWPTATSFYATLHALHRCGLLRVATDVICNVVRLSVCYSLVVYFLTYLLFGVDHICLFRDGSAFCYMRKISLINSEELPVKLWNRIW